MMAFDVSTQLMFAVEPLRVIIAKSAEGSFTLRLRASGTRYLGQVPDSAIV
jgi:hypothetical protein